ncbi:FAD binding domain-containing protein [Tamlana flava]|uniref:FAD binding domain-containing protein n=1 Tax=Tamlana flava TaxID=3158572 RepID=UPI00351AFB61
MEIGIVGGSIAGCSAAFLLLRDGHEVTVFERSRKALVGRGGGIGTLPALIKQLKDEGLIKKNFASLLINKMPFVGKLASAEPYGKVAWAMPMSLEVFHWNELWKQLRSHVPDNRYNSGVRIVNAEKELNGKVTLTTAEGAKSEFDLVLFADGYHSLGRSILFPNKQLKYRGYVLWRGLLHESELGEKSPLKDEVLRLSYPGKPGHNVVYFIPNLNGSVKEGERIYNWAAYIALNEDELKEVMTDKAGELKEGTMPPGAISKRVETKLKDFLSQNTPLHYANIVNKTKDSYIQVIYTLDLDHYYKDNMCLIGDAGIVVQPFTGSGVFKGYNNVKDLIECLHEHKTLEYALNDWSNKQVENGKRLLVLGKQMEKAFIWEQPNFAHAKEDETAAWWKASVTFPENFSYEKK